MRLHIDFLWFSSSRIIPLSKVWVTKLGVRFIRWCVPYAYKRDFWERVSMVFRLRDCFYVIYLPSCTDRTTWDRLDWIIYYIWKPFALKTINARFYKKLLFGKLRCLIFSLSVTVLPGKPWPKHCRHEFLCSYTAMSLHPGSSQRMVQTHLHEGGVLWMPRRWVSVHTRHHVTIIINNKKLSELTSERSYVRACASWKGSLNFSIAIRVNLVHPWPSLFLYDLLSSLWYFSILVSYFFQVFFNLKVILYVAKITQNIMTKLPILSTLLFC